MIGKVWKHGYSRVKSIGLMNNPYRHHYHYHHLHTLLDCSDKMSRGMFCASANMKGQFSETQMRIYKVPYTHTISIQNFLRCWWQGTFY